MRKSTTVVILAVSLSLGAALGCGVQTPLAPSRRRAAARRQRIARTLKAGAPTLVSPINSAEVATQKPTLTISPAAGQFASQTFQYEFELLTDAGAVVTRATVASTQFYGSERPRHQQCLHVASPRGAQRRSRPLFRARTFPVAPDHSACRRRIVRGIPSVVLRPDRVEECGTERLDSGTPDPGAGSDSCASAHSANEREYTAAPPLSADR